MASRRSGPLRAYRIADRRHNIFDGQGAQFHGGRWNSPGRRIIYAAGTYAGAMLDMLAHANIGRLPRTHSWIDLLIGKNVEIEEVDSVDVPGWDAADQTASRRYGDLWYDAGRTAVLVVPSVVTRVEHNILVNQNHRDFGKIRATEPRPVIWDRRLFGLL